MARCTPCDRQEAPAPEEFLPPVTPGARETRGIPRDIPMYRYIHPIPPAPRDRGGGCGFDSAAVLEALEQQNRLLTELLGAVTSLTAACLCRPRPE